MRCLKCGLENGSDQRICGGCNSALAEPSVTVVIISDYASGLDAGWNDLRTTLTALAQQDFAEPADFVLVETNELKSQIPPDLTAILPTLRVISVGLRKSFELKNAAVQTASTELVAMIDADCAPATDWLRQLVDAIRGHPEAMAISGRTLHAGTGLVNRAMGAVDRSYVDVGRSGPTNNISNNNTIYRRSAFLAYPLATNAGAFASHLQSHAILRDGGCLLFEPAARVVHAYDGWAREWDFRREIGFAVIHTRRIEPRLQYSWLIHLSYLAIPLLITRHMLSGWWYCLSRGRDHGVAWYELPIAFVFVVIASCMEVPGMLNALRDQPPAATLFR